MRRCGGGRAWGDSKGRCIPIVYGAEKIYNITSWSRTATDGIVETQQPTKNGQAQRRKRRRRGTNVGEWQRDATNNKDAVVDARKAHALILVQDATIGISHLLGDPATPLHLVHPDAVKLEHCVVRDHCRGDWLDLEGLLQRVCLARPHVYLTLDN